MELRFDFAEDDATTGFRLDFFEFYNWGTYNKSIARLKLSGSNALLTGDIGSGKSTVVDALSTLLVPHHKIVYNKAAGAETKERTLYSYVVGEYKSSQDENFGNSKAIGLRDASNFTTLLARFFNEGFDESVTLAQFFWLKEKQVQKFFVVSQADLTIEKDFLHINDIRDLKKHLRTLPHTNVYDSFKEYSKDFTRLMGIKNEQALNLFYQSVSMKSVGNLTEFIRTHMLESNNIQKNIDELCSSFADLNHTHELVLKAKEQIELLEPLVKESKRYESLEEEIAELEKMKALCDFYFARFKKELVETKLAELGRDKTKTLSQKIKLQEDLKDLIATLTDLRIEMQKNGGERLTQIASKIEQLSKDLLLCKEENFRYNEIVKALGQSAISNEHSFLRAKDDFEQRYRNLQQERETIDNTLMFHHNSLERYKKEKAELDSEIVYLQNNPSNIPHKISQMRQKMAESLGVSSDDLPFVGELIMVKDEAWSGAIERVLHTFALSLIAKGSLYKRASEYVEHTKLGGKLVYLRVDEDLQRVHNDQELQNSLLHKIDLKVDSPFYYWLESELGNRFNFACVASLEEFRRYKKALSINGQFKSNLSRHEKDDRFEIDDRSRWVLGWNNLQKLAQIQGQTELLGQKIAHLENEVLLLQQQKRDLVIKGRGWRLYCNMKVLTK